MTSFRKYWLLAIILILFLSHLPFFGEPMKVQQNINIVAEKNIPLSKNTPQKTPAVILKNTLIFTKKVSKETNIQPEYLHSKTYTIIKEDALIFAKNASKETGVRPEYLYAIYDQETSRGENLGSCFIFDPKLFGPGIGINLRSGTFTSKIMKPERDIKLFFFIMEELGRNPYFTAVSCPMKNIGWGGGMGHMQFLPSTWILVKDRVAIALNKNLVDPWSVEDAMFGAAFHLKDLGADHQKVSAERSAACKYFSGKPCGEKKVVLIKKKHKKTKYKTIYVENSIIAKYGDSVVKKTAYFQKKYWPETIVAKADIKPKHKSAHGSKKQELAKNFQKSKKKRV